MYKELDSLHEKILNSKFAEEVTEQEILALVETKEIRVNAIDEFAEVLKKMVEKDLSNPDLMLDCKKCGIWKIKDIDEIAEQLKGGGKNG